MNWLKKLFIPEEEPLKDGEELCPWCKGASSPDIFSYCEVCEGHKVIKKVIRDDYQI